MRRVGPHDTWLDTVANKLRDRGFREVTRNTGKLLADVPTDADLVAERDVLRLVVRVFSNEALAERAARAWMADRGAGDAFAAGRLVCMSKGKLVVAAAATTDTPVPLDEFRHAVITVLGTPAS